MATLPTGNLLVGLIIFFAVLLLCFRITVALNARKVFPFIFFGALILIIPYSSSNDRHPAEGESFPVAGVPIRYTADGSFLFFLKDENATLVGRKIPADKISIQIADGDNAILYRHWSYQKKCYHSLLFNYTELEIPDATSETYQLTVPSKLLPQGFTPLVQAKSKNAGTQTEEQSSAEGNT